MQDVSRHPTPCLRCGRELDSVDRHNMPTQPYAATVFVAYGQYGSTVFDPGPPRMTGSRTFLEVNVCDRCLRECADLGLVMVAHVLPPQPRGTRYAVWTPDGELGADQIQDDPDPLDTANG